MILRVLCFGRLREVLAPELSVEVAEGSTVGELWTELLAGHPALEPYRQAIAIAVNQAFASADLILREADEVALLPPVSGGLPEWPLRSAHARLERAALDTAALRKELNDGADGALCAFEGVVRNHTRQRRTLYLEYESYPEMALAEMERLAEEALEQFAIRDCRIAHRVGRLEIGECSVLILVASAHRGAAFEACRWLIDTLKQRVPIWKKEFFADGSEWAAGDPFPAERLP